MSSVEIAAFILAGGRSSRMNADKAFLRLEGTTLVQHVLALARDITPEVTLVGSREKLGSFGTVVEDIYPNQGPLAGIHAALAASRMELNLMLAVDIPFVSAEFLRFLANCAWTSEAVVTVPRGERSWQPLCAIYRRQFAEIAEQALRAGRNRIDSLFSAVPVRIIEEAELRRFAFDPVMFDNLNTPEEFQRAQERIRQRAQKQIRTT